MKQKIVIKIQSRGQSKCFLLGCILGESCGESEGFRTKVMKKVAETYGVISVSIEGDGKDKVVVVGDGIDSTKLIHCLRKIAQANIEKLEEVKDKPKETTTCAWTSTYCYSQPAYILY